jgi:hypothetical protein
MIWDRYRATTYELRTAVRCIYFDRDPQGTVNDTNAPGTPLP